MANGQIIAEIRELLKDSEVSIPQNTQVRLTLAGLADVYEKVERIEQKVEGFQTVKDHVDALEKRVGGWDLVNSIGVGALIVWSYITRPR